MNSSSKEFYAIFGNPVNHSLSPQIFNKLFKKRNLKKKYLKISIASTSELKNIFRELNLAGGNITSPFKERIVSFTDSLDEAAESIQAVNLIMKQNDKIFGYNTDYVGLIESIKKYNLNNKRILIIGAGGAAKSAAYGLKEYSKNVTITNRTYEKAKKIANQFNFKVIKSSSLKKQINNFNLIISCLPPDVKVEAFHNIEERSIVFDVNYISTYLKEVVKNKNIKLMDGRKWLIHQAVKNYSIFTNKDETDYGEIEKILDPPVFKNYTNIILMGFMGSGKTTIGRQLSKKMNLDFVDIDEKIEKYTGLSINEIFSKKGEKTFRNIENKILFNVVKREKQLIAIGGGAVMNKSNRVLLKNDSFNIFIHAPVSDIIKRNVGKTRPLFDSNLKSMKKLYSKRKPFYMDLSDIIFYNKGLNPEKTVEMIHEEIGKKI